MNFSLVLSKFGQLRDATFGHILGGHRYKYLDLTQIPTRHRYTVQIGHIYKLGIDIDWILNMLVKTGHYTSSWA